MLNSSLPFMFHKLGLSIYLIKNIYGLEFPIICSLDYVHVVTVVFLKDY